MNDRPTITCPSCRTDIRLDESLAGPLVAATRAELEMQMKKQLAEERVRVAAAERQKLDGERDKAISDLALMKSDLATRDEQLREQAQKLTDARQKELELLRQQRELEEQRAMLELSVERRLGEERTKLREEARRIADEDHRLKMAEKDKRLADMQAKVEELLRKAEQGSQQLQGEVLELELEGLLARTFTSDTMHPVPKGEHGGDVLQRVNAAMGQPVGAILWETKRTKAWSHGWLPKLRDDQRAAKAEVAILVSAVLPDGIDANAGFGQRDGVWITTPKSALAVAAVLRQTLLEVSAARTATIGQKGKMELVYDYLTSPRFGQRVHAIIESFTTMREDLDKEKRAIVKMWAKREQQIERALGAAGGMYGDLQGIVGKSLEELDALDIAALEAAADEPPVVEDRSEEEPVKAPPAKKPRVDAPTGDLFGSSK